MSHPFLKTKKFELLFFLSLVLVLFSLYFFSLEEKTIAEAALGKNEILQSNSIVTSKDDAIRMQGAVKLPRDRKYLKQLAQEGDKDAQYALGVAYYTGTDVAKSADKAVEWFRQAAQQGHLMAKLSLSSLYLFGDGVKRDLVKAKKWLDEVDEYYKSEGANVSSFHGEGWVLNQKPYEYTIQLARTKDGVHALEQLENLDEQKKHHAIFTAAQANYLEYTIIYGRFKTQKLAKSALLKLNKQPWHNALWVYQFKELHEMINLKKQMFSQSHKKLKTNIKKEAKKISSDQFLSLNIQGEAWVKAQTPDSYTIKLISSPEKEFLRRRLSEIGLDQDVVVTRYMHNNQEWFTILKGSYKSFKDAKNALSELQHSLSIPFMRVRKLEFVQGDLNRYLIASD